MTEPKYSDFTDFILGITAEVWEGRGIGLLRDCYGEDIIMRSPSSIVVGNKEVMRATRQTLSEFPDRRLLGEDVIWERTGGNSWISSHRIYCTATHSGHGLFGEATGRRVAYRVIADCHAEECPVFGWKINDEWLVRDSGAILRCLGMTAKQYAETRQSRRTVKGGAAEFGGFRGESPPAGPYSGTGNESEPVPAYEDLLNRIMSDDFSAVADCYDPACQLELPGGITGHGIGCAERFWLGLRSSFPQAEFRIEHRIGRTDAGHRPRAALRWSVQGVHEGPGMFGDPSGSPVYIMGISHAEFGPRGLVREFVLIDETAVWQQILAGTDAPPCISE